MRHTSKVRVALTTAVVVLGIAAATTGVALALPTTTAQTAQPDGNTPADPQDHAALMDQMMQQMVQNLPADQRAAAMRMHEQMRPAMQTMMSGDMSAMGQMSNGMNGMMGGHGETGG